MKSGQPRKVGLACFLKNYLLTRTTMRLDSHEQRISLLEQRA